MEKKDTMYLSTVLSAAIFVFVLVKILFSVLGWYSQNDKDQVYRRQLDTIWDNLQTLSFFDIGHNILRKLVVNIQSSSLYNWKFFIVFLVFGIVINFFSFMIFIELYDYINGGLWGNSITRLKHWLIAHGFFKTFSIVAITAFLGTAFDLISVLITWQLIKAASMKESLMQIVYHIGLDIVIACLAISWAYGVFHFTTYILFEREYRGITEILSLIDIQEIEEIKKSEDAKEEIMSSIAKQEMEERKRITDVNNSNIDQGTKNTSPLSQSRNVSKERILNGISSELNLTNNDKQKSKIRENIRDALDANSKPASKLMEEIRSLIAKWQLYDEFYPGGSVLFKMREFFLGFVILGFSAALPTLIYFYIGITLFGLYFSPPVIQKIVMKIIFLVSTDDQPIFSQLGNVFGAIGAVIASLVAIIK